MVIEVRVEVKSEARGRMIEVQGRLSTWRGGVGCGGFGVEVFFCFGDF